MEKKMPPRQKKKKASTSTSAAKRPGGGSKQPVKIVYISTPVKLEISPSNFRSLVQEFTGQGAVWPFDPSHFSSSSSSNSCSHSFPYNQTLPISDDSHSHNIASALVDSTAQLSLDQDVMYDDDRVVLIDHILLNTVFDHFYDHFAGLIDPRR